MKTAIAGMEERKRLSNFEALRLLCMLMILNLHSFWGYQHGSGVWQALDFFRESTSICAVDCFVLISGYFGIKWKFKSFFNLIFQIFFYSIGIYLVAVGIGVVNWSFMEFALRFACLFTSSWGFVINYIILYFCAPVLNVFSENKTSRELLIYIIVFFVAINFVSLPESSFFTYALVYLIGRFLNKINISTIEYPARKAYWGATVIIFLLVYGLLYKTLHISDPKTINKLPIGVLGFAYSSPFVILQAVFLFICFARMNFYSKIINWCAASSFAIFLIHMHPTIKKIGYYSFTSELYELPVLQHILYLILLIIFVFFMSIAVDKIRLLVSNFLYHILETLIKLIPSKWKSIDTFIPSVVKQVINVINK